MIDFDNKQYDRKPRVPDFSSPGRLPPRKNRNLI